MGGIRGFLDDRSNAESVLERVLEREVSTTPGRSTIWIWIRGRSACSLGGIVAKIDVEYQIADHEAALTKKSIAVDEAGRGLTGLRHVGQKGRYS